MSGTYAIDGVPFILSPTDGGWNGRDVIGIDGNGHPIYPSLRSYSMHWGLAHPNDVKQFIDSYNLMGSTGTLSFDLPRWGDTDYNFHTYSGCTMEEPQVGKYFNGYITDVTIKILKIETTQ